MHLRPSLAVIACLAAMAFEASTGRSLAQEKPEAKPAEAKVAAPYATAHARPLDPKEEVVEQTEAYTQLRVEFNGIKDDRVPAYLYVPKRKADALLPAVLLQYGSGGNKKTDYIVAIGKQFVARGFVVLTIDSPNCGERRSKENKAGNILGMLNPDFMMQYCGDYSRAIDFLITRPEVDSERLGYVGISWGAITGITFVAYDPRIKAMGSMVGGGNFLGAFSAREAEKAAKEGSKSADPVYHVARIAPRPLLFVNVTRDQLILRPWAESLHKAAGDGATVVWHETDHYFRGVDRAAICESVIDFMVKELPTKRPADGPPK